MPQVIIEQPGVPPITVPLSDSPVQFGRAEDNDVVLVADEVSRHHAMICRRDSQVVLVDKRSLNGTYVNRQRIMERALSHRDGMPRLPAADICLHRAANLSPAGALLADHLRTNISKRPDEVSLWRAADHVVRVA